MFTSMGSTQHYIRNNEISQRTCRLRGVLRVAVVMWTSIYFLIPYRCRFNYAARNVVAVGTLWVVGFSYHSIRILVLLNCENAGI